MQTVGIIAEYNPFHRGHAWQLQQAKKLSGADYAVIVMSGDFVQRGYPAITDKYVRAEMALRSGADLVLELPVSYATGSAEAFAQGAVAVLDALGCVDTLCFGSESGDADALLSYARLFEEEPPAYRQLLKDGLRQGLSFPAARSLAAGEYRNFTERILPCCADDADCRRSTASLLDEPNNILGIEYCRALLRRGSRIRPLTIRRRSSGYHDLSLDTDMASASAIRRAVRDACADSGYSPAARRLPDEIRAQLPPASAELLEKSLAAHAPVTLNDFSAMLSYRLLTISEEDLAGIQDIGTDLAARICNLRRQYTTAEDFADLLKTRQLTHTRITRALCHILLDLKEADLNAQKADGWSVYLRVLGFREDARPLLGEIKKRSALPLLVKAADAPTVLPSRQLALFKKDVFAAHLYESARVLKKGEPLIHEYTRSPILLPPDACSNS